jgi:hypothetical protein
VQPARAAERVRSRQAHVQPHAGHAQRAAARALPRPQKQERRRRAGGCAAHAGRAACCGQRQRRQRHAQRPRRRRLLRRRRRRACSRAELRDGDAPPGRSTLRRRRCQTRRTPPTSRSICRPAPPR